MIDIREALVALGEHAPGTVVYLGSGIGSDVADVAAMGALRCVLVDGNERVCAQLERGCRGRSTMEVVHAVVGPVRTTATWHSHNLRRFDGLIDVQGLSSVYPRLASTSSLTVSVDAIDSLLARLNVQVAAGRPNLLIVDVPGAAATLLECAAPDALTRFEHIIVRHDPPALSDSTDAASALARLDRAAASAGYRLLSSVPDRAALWALSSFRSDALSRHNAELAHQISALKTRLTEADAEVQAMRQREEQAAIRWSHQRDEVLSLQTQLEFARAETVNLASRAEQLQAERDQLTQAHVVLIQQIGHWSAEAARLTDELATAYRAVEASHSAREQLAGERNAAMAAMDETTRLMAQSEIRHTETLKTLRELELRAQQSDGDLSELQQRWRACHLDNENAAIDRQRVREELLRAEAQIELLKNVVFGEARP